MEESVRWLICSHCPKKFKKPLDMVRHLRIHNSVKPYKCHVCQRSFRLKSTLMSHLNSHSGVKNFTCPICGKKLASRSSLALHQRLHSGQRPYNCQWCAKQFRHRSYFKVHVQSHERAQSAAAKNASKRLTAGNAVPLAEPLQVTQSGMQLTFFFYRFELNFDMILGILQREPLHWQLFAAAAPKRPFKCQQCGAAFKKSAHLRQHATTHSGVKPFTCSICL